MLKTDHAEEAIKQLKFLSQTTYGFDRATSHYLLGRCYENGEGVEKSQQAALYHYELAAKNDYSLAQIRLGEAYLYGELGLDPSPEISFSYHKLAAERGYLGSWRFLVRAYEEGIGVERSKEQAEIYRKKIVSRCKAEADRGDPLTQVLLGMYYDAGTYVEKSPELAFKYFTLAAEQNYPFGVYKLGTCYEEGTGVEVSLEKALECFHRAASLGCVEAQLLLAVAYKNGELGLEISLEQGLFYYHQAAEQGCVEAAEFLANESPE